MTNNTITQFEKEIRRKAIVLSVGGFRPPDDPLSSWFGEVNYCSDGERWPTSNGKPMLPLAQVNLNEFPYKPDRLENLEFLTIFIDSENLPVDEPNGEGWELRTYKSTDNLVQIEKPEIDSHIKPFPMKAYIEEPDYPCWADVAQDCPDEIDGDYLDLYENIPGFKFGGWPTLLQGEIIWAPWNKHPASPEYVFQIDTLDHAHWSWGDSGVGYFGLGTITGKENEWALKWQCY